MASSHEQRLATLYRERDANFQTNFAPLLDELSQDANSHSMVLNAERQASQLPEMLEAMSKRNQSRFAGGVTNAQRMQISQSQNSLGALSSAGMVNQSRVAQRARNTSLRADLMDVSEQMINKGSASLTQFASNEAARREAAAKAKSGFMSNLLSLGGAVVGGMVGGPVGASIGAGVGGAVGSQF